MITRASPSFGSPLRSAGAATDRFGTLLCTRSEEAVAAFGDAVEAIAGHRPDVAAAIERALGADPGLVAAHAARAFGSILLARPETIATARLARDAAHHALAEGRPLTCDEVALLAALDHALAGRLLAAAAVLDGHLARHPDSLLLLKLSCGLRFMGGDLRGMRHATGAALGAWHPGRAGYGFVLGCHAFALEETGDLAAAERVGREAVEREPKDAWGLHAVAHVHEMTGRVADGIDWIERTRPLWGGCNNFAFHLAWHLALFHLERGDRARVIELYDTEIRPAVTEDFRDVANAVSLLWRLRQGGIDVGDRWHELAAIARRRRHEATLVFATLHHLLALGAVGDLGGVGSVLLTLQREAAIGSGDQSRVAATVGVPFARALLSLLDASHPCPPIEDVAAALPELGGSHAQRDLFLRILIERAGRDGDARSLARLLDLRRRRKRDDRFAMALSVPGPAWC